MRGASSRVTLDAADAIAARPVPMHLVWGAADPFFRVSLAERLAARVPGCTTHFIPGAHTYAMLDAPGAVAEAIRGAIAA